MELPSPRPRAVVVMSDESFAEVFTEEGLARLHRVVDIVGPVPITGFDAPGAREALREAAVMVTGWGAPRIDADVLDLAPQLKALVHTAGTVKTFLDAEAFRRGIRVSTAAAANATPVAEFTFAAIVFGLKRASRFADQLRTTRRHRTVAGLPPLGTNGITIGILGASKVGREVIRMISLLQARILVADPYLTSAQAAALGVEHVSLEELCRRSDVLSLHAPSTPDTRHIVSARELALLHDGAVVINTARGALIDTDALAAELVTGRLDAYLDVTDPEPLPADSPLYSLPNVVLTPHIAGALGNEIHRLGDSAVREVEHYVGRGMLVHELLADELAYTA
ncbi:hydroxyacid dehydrogenase [Microbacterium capsulatum]|uniref:Hydroxyacid dehydrogenase n=1 Tax=Microbacterium capsulatum TaxID=3041921 RepID=A0ABU0XL07_9MICO|nr:hydroxyacid dehydrogenase [Microbacterium sp. ASV81]MDQ4215829.1 hydroxyacid dehydrogenase [Microbacterium sp. ASV81]